MFGFFKSSSSSDTTEIKDYGVFTDGINLTNNKNKEINAQNEVIRSIRAILQSDDVFMGPIRDSSVKALESAENKLSIIEENLATISMYLAKTSESYQNADSKACEVISLNTQTGKMEIKKGVYGAQYKAPSGANLSKDQYDFINTIKDYAIESYNETGVLPSLTIAQAIHESGWGKYAINGNLYGIKARGKWKGGSKVTTTQEYVNGSYITKQDSFRTYSPERQPGESDEDYKKRQWYLSTMDHGQFLVDNSRYEHVLTATNYKQAAYEVKKAGYATGAQYAEHIIETVEQYGLNQWDPAPSQK